MRFTRARALKLRLPELEQREEHRRHHRRLRHARPLRSAGSKNILCM